jgi:integrase
MMSVKALLSDDKVSNLIRALDNYHPRFGLLFALGVETGLRISDLLRLRVRDVKLTLHVTERKTKRKRSIDISPWMLLAVELYAKDFSLKKTDFLFWSKPWHTDKPMSRQWAYDVISRVAKENGLQGIGTHSMRKTYACDLYRRLGSVEAVQNVLGHKHIQTTMAYVSDAKNANLRG